ncbi:MAG: hypothetical protein QF364_07485 [Candidatus Poseidoniaceae archaeon]|nr:hypothetical protein [Candidatus Poseidoniaceae archaeon]
MVEAWLEELMVTYNQESYASKDAYTAQIHLPGHLFEKLVWWALQALPDEILVGMDINSEAPHNQEVELKFRGSEHTEGLFQGQGFIIGEAHIVNRGDSYSVHHLPEDWTDDMFSTSRGSRAGRFTHWLHTHPNAPAIPSHADADAAQETSGVDMILGLRFSPEGPLPWFDDVEGVRRRVGSKAEPVKTKRKRRSFFARQELKTLGVAPSGHKIHEIQLIAFRKNGLGINVIMVDQNGYPYGWENLS